ncbi:hypothetical protein GCM10027589_15160 [Actinocorallia lasiicapitis]
MDGVAHRPGVLWNRYFAVTAIPALALRWGLSMAAFDLLDSPAGICFLEVNVACGWFVYERIAGDERVSDGVIRLLVDRAAG